VLDNTFLFFKKIYKPVLLIAIVVAFFAVYNNFLIDRSMINLNVALNSLNQAKTVADLQKIKPFLKVVLLNEISKKTTSGLALTSLESMIHVVDTAKSVSEVEQVKFFLENLLAEKKNQLGGFRSAINALSSKVIPAQTSISDSSLETEARKLANQIRSAQGGQRDKDTMQGLYFELASVYLKKGDINQVYDAYMKAIETNPASPLAAKAKFNLAWAYKDNGNFEEAIRYFEQVSRESAAQELGVISKYQLADVLLKKGDYEAASGVYAQLSEEFPEFNLADLALYEAALISFYNLGDRERALKYLLQLEDKFPHSKIIRHEMDKLRPVMAKDMVDRGYILLKEKKYPEAVEVFKRAVWLAPQDGRSLIGLGLGYYWMDLKSDAIEEAKKASKVAQEEERVLTNCLFVFINSGAVDDAIRIAEAAMARKSIKKAEFYYNLGYAYILKAKVEQARNSFNRTIRLNPDFVYAYNNLGCAFWTVKDYDNAIKRFKEAIAIDPTYKDAHFNLGVAHFYVNQLQEAYNEFMAVKEMDPNYKDIQKYINRVSKELTYKP